MYNVLDICQYILYYYHANEKNLSNLKLQKILYFLQAEFLVAKNIPCFKEPIMAWGCGPMIPKAYHEYKVFGGALIPNFNAKNNSHLFYREDLEIIDEMLKATINYSSTYMTQITLKQTPWKQTYSPYFEREISHKSIKDFFGEN